MKKQPIRSCRINFQNYLGLQEHNKEYHSSQTIEQNKLNSSQIEGNSDSNDSSSDNFKSNTSKNSRKRKPCICGKIHRTKPDCRGRVVVDFFELIQVYVRINF